MKRKILSLLLTFCLALIPGLCVNAETADAAATTTAPTPYHVDLSDFFEADIFYDAGDTDSSIGFDANGGLTTVTNENANFAFPRSVVTGSSFLNNGVLSFSGTDIKLSYGYQTVHSNLGCIDLHQSGMSSHDSSCQATNIFRDAVPTLSFDVASIVDNTKNNAVVIPHDAETKPTTQTIAGVFSGNPTKYLSFLFAVPKAGGRQYMTVTYADGTTEEFYINHNTSQNSTVIGNLQAIPMYYNTTEGWTLAYDDSKEQYPTNYVKLVACAIDTGDRAVSSVVLKRLESWNSGKYSAYANLPVLAITEIPSSSEYIEEQIAAYVNGADYTANISDAASYLKAKKVIEYKELLDERGYTLSDATLSEKISNLQKQYNAMKPHMVDLTSYFNRDVFAKEGEKVAEDWGYNNEQLGTYGSGWSFALTTAGLNLANVTPYLSANGILSENSVVNTVNRNDAFVSTETLKAAVAETPFDLSNVTKDKNALVQDEGTRGVQPAVYQTVIIEQNAEKTVFSGKPADYLLVLSALGYSDASRTYTITFTDGTTIEKAVSYAWAGNYYSKAALNVGERLYLPEGSDIATLSAKGADPYFNRSIFVVDAIPLNGKKIKSVKSYSHSYYGNAPLLAMTEVTAINTLSDKAKELETLVNTLPANLNTTAAYQNYKKACESLEELESAGWTLDETLATKLSAYDKQYEALKPHMVDLTDYFNRDIFATEGENVAADWGYINKNNGAKASVGMDQNLVLSALSADGILSSNSICNFYGPKGDTDKRIAKATIEAAVAETPFDLSHLVKANAKNALTVDEYAYDGDYTYRHAATINGFSGKNTDYLLVLTLHANETAYSTYKINYEDGDSETFSDISTPWAEQMKVDGFNPIIASSGKKLVKTSGENDTYTAQSSSAFNNATFIYAQAFPLKGKPIKSVEYGVKSHLGVAPLLAMTEVVSLTSTQDKIAKVDSLIKEINGDVVDVTTQKKAVEAIEIASTLEEAGYALSADTASKIAVYKKQLAGLEPHMVDLTSAFNRDIFAKENEIVSTEWGFLDGMMPIKDDGSQDKDNVKDSIKVGLIEDDVKAVLTDNIFSKNEVATFYNRQNGENTILLDKAALSEKIVKTPFDLSQISEAKNAIAVDTKDEAPVIINSGFSGKAVKYLLVLSVSARNDCTNTYEVTYTDGTTVTYAASTPWAGAIQETYASAAAAFREKAYYEDGKAVKTTGGSGNNSLPNRAVLTASAIELPEKAIASIKVLPHAYGIAPIIAMTEIPIGYNELKADYDLAWDGTFTNENADLVIKKSEAAIELYNRGYSTVSERWYNTYLAANKKAKAIKAVGVDKIYAVNEFSDDGTNVTANVTLTNTSSVDKNYILVIAAYSENGEKLIDLDYGTQSQLSSEAIEAPASISIPVNNEATSYKLFVWENLSSLKPIATFTK